MHKLFSLVKNEQMFELIRGKKYLTKKLYNTTVMQHSRVRLIASTVTSTMKPRTHRN